MTLIGKPGKFSVQGGMRRSRYVEQLRTDFWYNPLQTMRVYLDNCCYNRPFDEQTQLRVRLEIEAKLRVQAMMRTGEVEYAWSDMLSLEVADNPVPWQREKIVRWAAGAVVIVEITDGVRESAHLACASAVDCDWFLTVDKGILKKVREYKITRVANPVEFIMENEYGND